MSIQTCGEIGSERRRLARVALPVTATIAGTARPAIDLSLGGFRVVGDGNRPGDAVTVWISVHQERVRLEFSVRAQAILHAAGSGHTGFRFVDLRPEQAYLLDALVTAAQAGSGKEAGDEFLKYASDLAARATFARALAAPLAI